MEGDFDLCLSRKLKRVATILNNWEFQKPKPNQFLELILGLKNTFTSATNYLKKVDKVNWTENILHAI